jgi:tRNA threonylcarbamoyladenosine modification (KEOPS) complex  Pcc1 subunit
MVHEVRLRLLCKKPEIVKKSLEPDIKNNESLKTEIRAEEGLVEITVKGEKLSHLKAIINSYLSIISTLNEIENIR